MPKNSGSSKLSKAELQSKERLESQHMTEVTERTKSLVSGCTKALWALALAVVVHSLAGTETVVKASLEAIFKAEVSEHIIKLLWALICGSGWLTAARIKAVKNKEIEQLAKHANDLERRIDPARSSSRLGRTGEPTLDERRLLGPGENKQ